MAHGILSAFPPITAANTLHGRGGRELARNWSYVAGCCFCNFWLFAGSDDGLVDSDPPRGSVNIDAGKLNQIMTVLDALAILEAAPLECKQRDIYTPEVKEALDLLQQRIWPEWLIPQFRYHARLNETNEIDLDKDAQQQALRAIFPCIRESVN